MKLHTPLLLLSITALLSISTGVAQPKRSLLDNDPDVIYLKEHMDRTIHLLVVEPATVYATKKGVRKLGTYAADTKVELLAMTDKAYRVKGKAIHAGVTGWVNPQLLASKDKDFIANLKKMYSRQITVKKLIAQNDIAIGMTTDEVKQSLGEPTETEIKQTREGETGQWHFIVTEEQKHYRLVHDRHTGNSYRQLSHTTQEEKSRISIEFKENTATSITHKHNNGPRKVNIIPIPVVFHW